VIDPSIRPDLEWAAVKGSFVLDCALGKVDPRLGAVPEREHVETLFALHCRDLVHAIDQLPEDHQPLGWQVNWKELAG
jgi:hypothetical protein